MREGTITSETEMDISPLLHIGWLEGIATSSDGDETRVQARFHLHVFEHQWFSGKWRSETDFHIVFMKSLSQYHNLYNNLIPNEK